MILYLDCELTHLPIDGAEDPGLVSIGCVSDNDKTFYAENADINQDQCNDWVIENVLMLLDGSDARMPYSQIASSLKAWIESFEEPVTVYTDAPHVDWPPLFAMFYKYGWPNNLIRKPEWLWFDHGVIDNLFVADQSARRHHALDDAVMNKLAHEIELNGTKR